MSGTTDSQAVLDICNLALGKIGSKFTITSITGGDSSAEAAQCGLVYYDKLYEVLEGAPFTFAQKRAMLATVGGADGTPAWTNDRMTIVYAKPSDFIKANYKNLRWARMKLEGPYILSDSTGLGIKYTFKNTTVSTYTPKFKAALVCRIAAEICFPLTESLKKAEALLKEYEEIRLPEAISSDSQQGQPDGVIADQWEMARMVGDVALVGQSGQDVWFPVN